MTIRSQILIRTDKSHDPALFAAASRTTEEPSRVNSPSTMRRDLRAMTADGATYSVMVGVGESYLPAFALALGMGEVVAGLIACVPLLAGAVLQLVSPYAVRKIGSYRRWVVACVTIQAASFAPLVVAALIGHIPVLLLFVLAGTYWAAGMATGPAWATWATTIVPERVRSRFFARRNRLAQFAVLCGFVGGGLILQFGNMMEHPLEAFAVIFLIAGMCRWMSARLIASQSEPLPPDARMHIVPRHEILGRLKNQGEGRLLIYLWLMYATAQISGPFFTPYMLVQLEYSYVEYMLILATSFFAKTLAMPWLGAFAHRYGSRQLLVLGGLLVIPLPALWLVSSWIPYLIGVQILAGVAWGAFELAIVLTSFDCIPASHRISMLTVYNLGYAIASVGGSLVGGLLLKLFGEGHSAYLAVFAISGLLRCLTLLLVRGLPHPIPLQSPPQTHPATLQPDIAEGEELVSPQISASRSGTVEPAIAP